MTVYKITSVDGSSCHGGSGRWPLPSKGADGSYAPGAWRDVRPPGRKLRACIFGLHLVRAADLVDWIGPALWEAEYEGEVLEADGKIVVRRARLLRPIEAWTPALLSEFAKQCAIRAVEHARMVLPIFKTARPADDRPRKALEASEGLLGEAAYWAAWAAGTPASNAWAAARAAGTAASNAWAATRAAGTATSNAWAAGAAREAAREAAWAAGAAREAAREAAWAAGAAREAAREAAWAAGTAREAAWAAGGAAENEWQRAHLLDLLELA